MGFDPPDAGRLPGAPPAVEHAPAWPQSGPPGWPPSGPAGWPVPQLDPDPDTYRDTRRRSIVARVLIGLSGVVALIGAVEAVGDLGLARALNGTDPYSVDAVLADAERTDGTYGGGALLYLVTSVAFLAWLVRALSNVRPLTGRQPKHTRRGAIGWWFVPIAWWFMPYRVVREVHESIDPMARAGSWRWLRLTWWMALMVGPLLVVVGVIGVAGATYTTTDRLFLETVGTSEAFVLTSTSLGALTAFAAVLAIVLMGRMQSAEDALALGTVEPAAAARSALSPWAVPLLSALGIAGILVMSAAVATEPNYSGTWARYAADDGSFSVEVPGTPTIGPSEGWRVHVLDRGVYSLEDRHLRPRSRPGHAVPAR